MFDVVSKAFFHTLAGSRTLKKLASRYGVRPDGHGFARRFIAGENIEEAIAAARALQSSGMLITLDLLGESVSNAAEATAATRGYLAVIDRLAASGVERNLSVKLTQLGLDIDRATCVDNLRTILDKAGPLGFFVRIDMENSPYVETTLGVFETLWQHNHRNIGVVLQSALRRSEDDARRINALGARVRLVKGAYKEPRTLAYQHKSEVDAAFVRITELLLKDGVYPAIATHDEKMIDATKEIARRLGLAQDRYEFQMLYGIRRDLQTSLVAEGYRMRVYTPFGREWFPYFMRRLGERPANVGWVLKGLVSER
ncbi:MAG TPA: proline dehydrogenase family protein [Vicinamibacterales bacterium]|nr:proline dehydrogenase family protein [Vicinamibacterales bacterium]